MERPIEQSTAKIAINWNRIPVLIRAITIGMVVNTTGVGMWVFLGTSLPMIPALLINTIFLWLYWKYFSGSWGPASTVQLRKENFRQTQLEKNVWIWGLLVAILFFISKLTSGELVFRLWEYPTESYSATLDYLKNLSTPMAVLAIVMISVVAGIAEEIGFRGYMQVPLEKRYGPLTAILIVSAIFTLVHVPHASHIPYLMLLFTLSMFFGYLAYSTRSLLIGIIVHALLDIHAFMVLLGYIGDGVEVKPTIFTTGIDSHFVINNLVMIMSTILFILLVRMQMKKQKMNEGKTK